MIDWFTVGAQVVNFLILMAILRYFLYGRILKAIDDRRRSIEQQRAEQGPLGVQVVRQGAAKLWEHRFYAAGRAATGTGQGAPGQ